MFPNFYDLAKDIIGEVPIFAELIYWLGAFIIFLLVIKVVFYIFGLSKELMKR